MFAGLKPVQRIRPSELAAILTGSETGSEELVVIDVRDSDFRGGHIRGCKNVTSDMFYDDDDIDKFISEVGSFKKIVFHCMKSQVRGPKCARRTHARVTATFEDDSSPDIYVLEGGFEDFIKLHKDLCEDVDEKAWKRGEYAYY